MIRQPIAMARHTSRLSDAAVGCASLILEEKHLIAVAALVLGLHQRLPHGLSLRRALLFEQQGGGFTLGKVQVADADRGLVVTQRLSGAGCVVVAGEGLVGRAGAVVPTQRRRVSAASCGHQAAQKRVKDDSIIFICAGLCFLSHITKMYHDIYACMNVCAYVHGLTCMYVFRCMYVYKHIGYVCDCSAC